MVQHMYHNTYWHILDWAVLQVPTATQSSHGPSHRPAYDRYHTKTTDNAMFGEMVQFKKWNKIFITLAYL